MAYNQAKHDATMTMKQAYALANRAYYAEPSQDNLKALSAVSEALDKRLIPYYMGVAQ